MGFRATLHGSNPELLMSALCQKRTLCGAAKSPYSIASSAATSRLCGTVTEHEQLAANRDTADL